MNGRALGTAIALLIVAACDAGGSRSLGAGGERGLGARQGASDGDAGSPRTIEVGGRTRSFYFWAPAGTHSERVPLVIVFHGGYGSPRKIAGQTGFSEVADRHGFAVAYPASIDHWNDGRDATAGFGDDTAFTSALIEHLVDTEHVDRNRIYVTGASNGGLMTLRLACERADEIAAFAVVAASFPDTYMSRCRPRRPVPIMIMHGSEDRLIPEAGATIPGGKRRLGGTIQPLRDTVEFWRQHDGCRPEPDIRMLPDSTQDGTTVRVMEYRGCAPGAETIFVDVIGGGHTWPGARVNPVGRMAGPVSHDIDGTQVIWEFFRNHTLDGSSDSVGSTGNEQHGASQ